MNLVINGTTVDMCENPIIVNGTPVENVVINGNLEWSVGDCAGGPGNSPDAPAWVTATNCGDNVLLTWGRPFAGAEPTSYKIEVDGTMEAQVDKDTFSWTYTPTTAPTGESITFSIYTVSNESTSTPTTTTGSISPKAPLNVEASSDNPHQVRITWTAEAGITVKVKRYTVSVGGAATILEDNITGGSFNDTTGEEARPYFYSVQAYGSQCESVDSLRVEGTRTSIPIGEGDILIDWGSVTGAGSEFVTSKGNGLFVFNPPEHINNIRVCMIGGGGGGGAITVHNDPIFPGGGYAGDINNFTLNSHKEVDIHIGLGGEGSSYHGYGKEGKRTIFGTMFAEGGDGGHHFLPSYGGRGEQQPPNCFGIFNDGIASGGYYGIASGGEAGFEDGGKGGQLSDLSTEGIAGSGGGSGVHTAASDGGKGRVSIKWDAQ